MKFKYFSITGPKGDNQDAILPPFQIGNSIWCAIADGVGSSKFGGIAARASLEVVMKTSEEQSMERLFATVRDSLLEQEKNLSLKPSLSTTLSVLRVTGNKAFVGHVGDTRISQYRDGGTMGRTVDQTEVQKLLDDGAITKNQARRYPRKNVLISAMSTNHLYTLFENEFDLKRGDRILLTTDGFHGKLLRREIAEESQNNPVFDDFWNSITDRLSSKKIDDDASCLAIEID